MSQISQITEVAWNCFMAWFYIYGVWLYSSEVVCCAFPIAIIGSFTLFLILHVFRVSPPDRVVVESMLGIDPAGSTEENRKPITDYFMKTCAHRFACLDAPENSISAIRKSKEKGCTFVEFDVALTKDNVPILFHDSDVNRLCDASGTVKDMTWEELSQLDISVKHPLGDRFTGEKIAHFDEAIKLCLDFDYRMFIDLKSDNMKLIPFILDAFKNNVELYNRAIVSSFNPMLIYNIRRANPLIMGSLAWRPYMYSYQSYAGSTGPERPTSSNPFVHFCLRVMDHLHEWLLNNIMYYLLGISTILLHKDILTGKVAAAWRKRGIRAMAFTVNLPIEKQYFRRVLKVSYLTDTLDTEGC